MNLKFYRADAEYCDFLRQADPCVKYVEISKRVSALIALLLILVASASCRGGAKGGGAGDMPVAGRSQRAETQTADEDPAPAEEPARPAETPAPSPKPTEGRPPKPSQTTATTGADEHEPKEASATSGLHAPVPLTYAEALAVCIEWLDENSYEHTESIDETDYDMDVSPPPTFMLFGEEYYEFFVDYFWEQDVYAGYTYVMLVHAEKGETLSLSRVKPDGERLTVAVRSPGEWGDGAEGANDAPRLTANEAIAVYEAWIDARHGGAVNLDTRLDEQSYDIFELFGEKYYYFHAESDYNYWYNILVHMSTGELLFLGIEDGMFGGTNIWRLEDWFDRL